MHQKKGPTQELEPQVVITTPDYSNVLPQKYEKLQKLLGKTKQQYVALRNIQKWMRSHASSDWKIVDNINNMVFAKDFFEMIDEDEQGEITLEQI